MFQEGEGVGSSQSVVPDIVPALALRGSRPRVETKET